MIGGLSIIICINAISKNWSYRTYLGLAYILLIGFSFVSQNPGAFESVFLLIVFGLVVSAILFVLYKDVIRFYPYLVPVVFGTVAIIATITKGYPNLYTGQFLGACISSVFIAGISFVWYELLRDR